MKSTQELLTAPVVRGVRAELQRLRENYVALHETQTRNASYYESLARDAYENADCALVMIAKLDEALKEIKAEGSTRV